VLDPYCFHISLHADKYLKMKTSLTFFICFYMAYQSQAQMAVESMKVPFSFLRTYDPYSLY
jgi:hypothetical protein